MWLIAGQGLLLQQTWMELVCERMAEEVSSCWSHQQARFKRKTGQDPVMDYKMSSDNRWKRRRKEWKKMVTLW